MTGEAAAPRGLIAALDAVRQRPGMYLGPEPDLAKLHDLITGYRLALRMHGLADPDSETLRAFEKSLPRTPACGTVSVIEERARAAGRPALDQFFLDLDAFRECGDTA